MNWKMKKNDHLGSNYHPQPQRGSRAGLMGLNTIQNGNKHSLTPQNHHSVHHSIDLDFYHYNYEFPYSVCKVVIVREP